MTCCMSAIGLAGAIRQRKIGVGEAVDAALRAADKVQKEHNSFLAVAHDSARKRAAEIQARIDAGEDISVLAGVPIGIKDNISTLGIETTCASKMLEGYIPVFNATAVERIEQAGMIVIGKLNMDEFAMGGSSETGAFGAVRNPWDISRVAGGSSGGSAASVAARAVTVTLGSDTGGSIRQPCSFCGVTGIKPTYGAVSRYGLVAYASSLDQIGPIGADIDDCAALLQIISGSDEMDGTCVINQPFVFEDSITERLEGVKIGLPRNYFEGGIDDDVKTAVLAAAKELECAGAVIEDFDMPLMDYAIHAYYIIACAEASSNLSRYDGLKYGRRSPSAGSLSEVYRLSRSEGFGLEVKRRIMLGSFVLSSGYYDSYYKKALQTRAIIKSSYDSLFGRFDMILSPVAPTAAYKIGENIGDPLKMYMGDIYTVSVNLAGLPAVSLPCGFSEDGLPVGFQLIGSAFSEARLFRVARVYQRRTAFHKKRPGGGAA
ncbi:MAG: Asp-tRNA(Asn)/Glu-tRNA(Gln) amidotransferase subunit GatA [Oscillospiraceae bacterium]|nr:Asp-tRNA(Asn)/Glu-tRNA(Gln) amidotransferase subunit GatA [Oscillospiraceae bacterium]